MTTQKDSRTYRNWALVVGLFTILIGALALERYKTIGWKPEFFGRLPLLVISICASIYLTIKYFKSK